MKDYLLTSDTPSKNIQVDAPLMMESLLQQPQRKFLVPTHPSKNPPNNRQVGDILHTEAIDEIKFAEGPELELYRKEQRLNEKWEPIITYLENPNNSRWDSKERESLRLKSRYYELVDGLLYTKQKLQGNSEKLLLLVPKKFRLELIKRAHDHLWAGHVGLKKVYPRLKRKYTWPGMYKNIRNYIRLCKFCTAAKMTANNKTGLRTTRTVWEPWFEICIDLFGGLPRTSDGYKHILTVADTFSRWVEFLPLKTTTADEVADTLVQEIFCRFGVPRRILSDRGAQFTSSLMSNLYELLGIKGGLTAAEAPWTNSPAERPHRVLIEALRIYARDNHGKWKRCLPYLGFAIRSAVSATHGYTPYQLMFGRNARLPMDLLTQRPAELLDRLADIEPHLREIILTMSDMYTTVKAKQDELKEQRLSQIDKENRKYTEFKVGEAVILKRPQHGNMNRGIHKKMLLPGQWGWFITERQGEFRYGLRNRYTNKITSATADKLLLDLATQYELRLRERAYNRQQNKASRSRTNSADVKSTTKKSPMDDLLEDDLLQENNKKVRKVASELKAMFPNSARTDKKRPSQSHEHLDNKHGKRNDMSHKQMDNPISVQVYDPKDPFSKVFEEGDVIAFCDIDGKNAWRLGIVKQTVGTQVFVQYFGSNRKPAKSKRHYTNYLLAWYDDRDGKATHAASRVDPEHQPWITGLDPSEVLMRLQRLKGKHSVRLRKNEIEILDRLRKQYTPKPH